VPAYSSIKFDAGQYNEILILNDEVVFRFPKYEESIATIVKEIRILNCIQGRVQLSVPNPIFSSPEMNIVGKAFMGYPLIPGEPLWRHIFKGIQDETILDRFASQLAGFLAELHEIPYAALGLVLPIEDTLDEWMDLFANIKTHLYEFMRSDAQREVTSHFEAFIDTPELHRFSPAIRHGDFGSTNILFDPTSMEITGILDFGFAGVGDPAIDLASVSTFGNAFYQKILAHYPATEMMLARAKFFRGTYALQEALHGFKNNDKDAFDAGMQAYRK